MDEEIAFTVRMNIPLSTPPEIGVEIKEIPIVQNPGLAPKSKSIIMENTIEWELHEYLPFPGTISDNENELSDLAKKFRELSERCTVEDYRSN
ncbi:hypothetical protein CA11_47310 [Gimesia maris]|nr:hypothetical protein CA11_47310 [Gimesia maris]